MCTTSEPKAAPFKVPAKNPITIDNPKPLAPPMWVRMPSSASFESVMGLPLSSITHPSGMDSLCIALTMILPRDELVVAMSITTGGSSSVGIATAIGFVPTSI